MDGSDCLQHLAIENAYIRYRYNQLRDSNHKLHLELTDLKQKLENLYKSQANVILMLQEKNQDLHKIIHQPPPSAHRPRKLRPFVDLFEDEPGP